MNQWEFWGKVGVTQSRGSWYERDREIPASVRMLIIIIYGLKIIPEAIKHLQISSDNDFNPVSAQVSRCIGCGCDDHHACIDTVRGNCSWIFVNYDLQIGVCSACNTKKGIYEQWISLVNKEKVNA
ncbi:hypothetical protein [Neisseria sp. Ec49-e6-T10]|uniref:hypothetical protein n=1 Tax=Neisseria sp. Ec49-e6-T10 TaxID=3140744 RepID=UPI003EBCAB72